MFVPRRLIPLWLKCSRIASIVENSNRRNKGIRDLLIRDEAFGRISTIYVQVQGWLVFMNQRKNAC